MSFGIGEGRFSAHENRDGMVGDHRGDELPIADQRLCACGCEGGEDDETRNEENVQRPLRIHFLHGHKHENAHGRDHGQRHVEHVEIVPEIDPAIDHGEMTTYMAEDHVDGESDIRMPAHPVLGPVLILHGEGFLSCETGAAPRPHSVRGCLNGAACRTGCARRPDGRWRPTPHRRHLRRAAGLSPQAACAYARMTAATVDGPPLPANPWQGDVAVIDHIRRLCRQ